MGIGKGTNYFDGSTVDVALTDNAGNAAFVRSTVANIPSAVANYAVGCILQATDTGGIYTNTGSITSATFTLLEDAGGSFTLPVTATDASTTTGTSMAFTQNAITTGIGFSQSLNGLTTGEGHLISHTTSVIADGGSLLRVTSSGIDTGGATNGTLLDLKSTGQLAGTTVRLDTILTTGTAASIISTGVMTTTGNLLTLTGDSATTAAGLLRVSGNALTSGIAAVISSSATAITGAGRLLYVNHSGATTTSGTLNEFVTSANDETILLALTANSLTSGTILSLSGTGLSSGKAALITTSSSSTDGGTSFEPVTIATTMTGAGGVGGRFKSSLSTNVALGAWSNAIKGEVTYGASGKTTGLGSSILGEMTLSAGTADGNYAPFEAELNLGAGALTGTATSLFYGSVNQTGGNTAFDDNGFILNLQGLTAGATDTFRTGLVAATVNAATTAALRIKIGSTTYYIPLATATA